MTNEQIIQLIQQGLPQAKIQLSNDDGRHIDAVIISEDFAGKNLMQRQRLVYQCLSESIAKGDIHAFSMKTYTPQEWEQANG